MSGSGEPAAEGGAYSGLLEGLRQEPKQLPCSYLYDARGSELYEQITELEQYYPFKAEQALLRQHARDIVSYIEPGSVVVELGCGSAAKTGILLDELLARDGGRSVRFAGVDCSGAALQMAKDSLLGGCTGLRPENVELVCAEYNDGIAECRKRFPNDRLCVLWLGSSVGNLAPPDAVAFFQRMCSSAGSNIQVLLCADLWKDREVLFGAYHDRDGVTEAFIKNGISHALGTLGAGGMATDPASWAYEVDVNPVDHQVEMWLRATKAIGFVADGVRIAEGERILVEVSRKFTRQQLSGLAYKSGLYIQAAWRSQLYSVQLLVTPAEALQRCWADTDAFFRGVPDWSTHPIAVRHPFCFYYGHVASFAKLQILHRLPLSEMDTTMSRGIDPDCADPSQCHAHPEVPAQWPTRAQLLQYVAQTRQLILKEGNLLEAGRCPDVMRRVCIAVEHERMHLETLAYMYVQKVKADFNAGPERPLTPRGSTYTPGPEFETGKPTDNTVLIPGGAVQMGAPLDGSAGFVWDNEGPAQTSQQHVAAFLLGAQPVTISEFYQFAVIAGGYMREEFWLPADFSQFSGKGQTLPATWSQTGGGEVYVHWPNGSTCGWRTVSDEPVLCSLAEAAAYCCYRGAGARIMSEPEYERALSAGGGVQQLKEGGWEWTSTLFEPLPGFSAMPEYKEYSTDFFDGKHFVLRGSSSATHPAVRRDSFRNFYQRQYPYVFAKFRLCFDA